MVKNTLLLATFCLIFLGCSQSEYNHNIQKEENVSAIIIGSAEHPDPILEKVRTLEQQGVLSNVVVMESFPVQISLTGPVNIVRELEMIPRKK